MDKVKTLVPFEWRGQRVLLTKQLAELFGLGRRSFTELRRIHAEFFREGKEIFTLEGEELKLFKKMARWLHLPIRSGSKAFLWTVSGVEQLFFATHSEQNREILAALKEFYFKPGNYPQVFLHDTFGSVRVVTINNEYFFVAADVCKILDIQNVSQALAQLDDDEKNTAMIPAGGIYSTYTPPVEQNMLVVNEPGLYRLIFASRKPQAKKFQRWVYHEVLPSLRQNGFYVTDTDLINQIATLKDKIAKLQKKMEAEKPLELACVYVFLMSNCSVKIGMSTNLTSRISELKRDTGLSVVKFYTTQNMLKSAAYELEQKLLKAFEPFKLYGEFFAVGFNKVVAELKRQLV